MNLKKLICSATAIGSALLLTLCVFAEEERENVISAADSQIKAAITKSHTFDDQSGDMWDDVPTEPEGPGEFDEPEFPDEPTEPDGPGEFDEPEFPDDPVVTPTILGDVNGDGMVNTSDARYVLRYVVKYVDAGINVWYGDVNRDGVINTSDARYILRYVVRYDDNLGIGQPIEN